MFHKIKLQFQVNSLNVPLKIFTLAALQTNYHPSNNKLTLQVQNPQVNKKLEDP